MWRVIILALLEAVLLTCGQVFLKLSIAQLGNFSWTWSYFSRVFTNLWLAATGICYLLSILLWVFLLKRYALSLVYPLASLSYVLGTLAAMWIFKDPVPTLRWVGLGLILVGCFLIVQK